MKSLNDYLAEVEAMQFVSNPAKPQGKKATRATPATPAADEAPIEYHSAEDSANFWEAVRNPLGGKDLSNLTPEEFVAELTKDQ